MKNFKIVITGGHLTPALALIEELKRQKGTWEIIFIGRKYALEGDLNFSEEYRIIRGLGIKFLPLATGRLTRILSRTTLQSLAKVPWGLGSALVYCLKERPGVVVSFGGYLALPVVLAAVILRIPVVTHEQTQVTGLANRLISLVATRICVSFPEMTARFPSRKVVFTGLPLRRQILHPPQKIIWSISCDLPLLYVTGGTTGAVSLNQLVFLLVEKLVTNFTVVHQTGRISLAEAERVKARLPVKLQPRYLPLAYLDTPEYAWVLHRAQIIIGRSGANTVGEIAAIGKVAIFIPLPWSAGGEQQQNANYLAQEGAAVVLDQKELDPPKLEQVLKQTISDYERYQQQAKIFAQKFVCDGANRLVKEILAVLPRPV